MVIPIGKALKALRLKRGLIQAKLARGIIDRSSLSKIESGRHDVSRATLELLADRLGHTAEYVLLYAISNAEFDVFELRDEMDNHTSNMDHAILKKLITKAESMPGFKEPLHRQFLLCKKAYTLLDNDPYQASLLLQEAITITIPGFNERLIKTFLLARNDIEIINSMATLHNKNNNTDRAIELLRLLSDNIRSRTVDPYEKARSLTLTLYNLSVCLGKQERYKDGLVVCNEGISEGQAARCYGLLPKLLYNKGYCLFKLGHPTMAEECIIDAYYTLRAYGLFNDAENIKNNTFRNFNISINS